MRLRRLDLLRYGRFTGAVLDFPQRDPDIHIVFGPNEAGKSTTLSAVEETLFGVDHHSRLDFLHNYASMRVGAVLETEERMLEIRRRKGRKDTLLDADDVPLALGEGALTPFLAGADRKFFTRMFCLDYERLREGGREILEARDDAGQALFAAGAGLAGLRERMRRLDDEADAQWGPRRAGKRRYTQAEDRLRAAEAALREHTVTAGRWQELKRAFEAAGEDCAALGQQIAEKTAAQRRLSRIRRVYRNVHGRRALEAERAGLGDAPLLPADARLTLEAASRESAEAAARLGTLTEQLAAERAARAGLACDEAFILLAEDIRRLQELRIRAHAQAADLPRLRAELDGGEAALRRLGKELGWAAESLDALIARIPPRIKVAEVRALLNRRGGLLVAAEAAARAVEDAEERIRGLETQRAAQGPAVDVSLLAAVIEARREAGDPGVRLEAAEAEAEEAREAVRRRLEALAPAVASEEALARIPVPGREETQRHRDARRALEQRLAACRERLAAAEAEQARSRHELRRLMDGGAAVSPEALAEMRRRRDAVWSWIRRRWLDGDAAGEDGGLAFAGTDGELAGLHEEAVREADALADRRFDGARAAARLADLSARIATQEDAVGALTRERERIEDEAAALDEAWRRLWAGAPFAPLAPDAMIEWLTARAEALALSERRAGAERRAAALRQAETQAKDELLAALAAVPASPGAEGGIGLRAALKDQPLRVIVERAARLRRDCEQAAEAHRKLEDSLRAAIAEAGARRRALVKAEAAWSAWEAEWTATLDAARFGSASAEAAAAQAEVIEGMREIAATVSRLRDERIAAIEREAEAFRREAGECVRRLAPDLAGREPDAVAVELDRRLGEAERARAQMAAKDEAIASLEAKIAEAEQARREAGRIIAELQALAGASGPEALSEAVRRSDRLRALREAMALTDEALLQDGDGLPLADLERDCADVDLDRLAAREEAGEGELAALRERLLEARRREGEARRAFEAIGGADGAARAAADRQAALAGLTEAAALYVRARSAALMLRWAIDRRRCESQGPMLRRAGGHFATLTKGSFTGLELAFDERDHARIVGVRPAGGQVGVDGMSTGTVDQLYLALRVAAVEDYLSHAAPLPFVADDLFASFDDERSGAGFEVLARLAERAQVLFFTHHWRLVELARSRLGPAVSISVLDASLS